MVYLFHAYKKYLTFFNFILLSSCVFATRPPTRVETTIPPPDPPVESPLVCTTGYAYMRGHWRWNGYQYFWIPQRCKYRPGFRYKPGGYYPCEDGYCYRKGQWIRIEK